MQLPQVFLKNHTSARDFFVYMWCPIHGGTFYRFSFGSRRSRSRPRKMPWQCNSFGTTWLLRRFLSFSTPQINTEWNLKKILKSADTAGVFEKSQLVHGFFFLEGDPKADKTETKKPWTKAEKKRATAAAAAEPKNRNSTTDDGDREQRNEHLKENPKRKKY